MATLDDETRKKIKFVVDINREKQGRYTAITGKVIRSPDALKEDDLINHILVMNPNYEDEILKILEKINKKFVIHKI